MLGVVASHYVASSGSSGPANSGSTTTTWTWGAGKTLMRPALLADGGYSVAPGGSAAIARSDAMPTGVDGSSVTAEAWINVPAANISGGIIKIGTGSNGWGIGVGGTTWDDTGKQLILLLEGLVWKPTGHNLATGTRHIVAVRSGTNFNCYVDGVSVATPSHTSVNTPTTVAVVGGSDGGRYLPASVDVDSAAIYTSALSGTRVVAHYNSGSGDNAAIAADSPAVWLKLDDTA